MVKHHIIDGNGGGSLYHRNRTQNDAGIMPTMNVDGCVCHGGQIDCLLFLCNGGGWLEAGGTNKGHAVGNAAQNAATMVGQGFYLAVLYGEWIVVLTAVAK